MVESDSYLGERSEQKMLSDLNGDSDKLSVQQCLLCKLNEKPPSLKI